MRCATAMSPRWSSPGLRQPSALSRLALQLHIVLQADPVDQAELHLDEVDVLLLAFEDVLQQLAG